MKEIYPTSRIELKAGAGFFFFFFLFFFTALHLFAEHLIYLFLSDIKGISRNVRNSKEISFPLNVVEHL